MRVVLGSLAALGALCALAAVPIANASSESAWREFNQRVTRSCIVASGFRNPRPSVIIGFDDRVGKVAMLVSDRTRHSSQAKLCLYDKQSRRAYVDDAEMWAAPPAPRGTT